MDHHYFLGLSVPDEARSAWAEWTEVVKEDLPFKQWVHPQDFHITLHFFGRLLQEQVDQIKQGMEELKVSSHPSLQLDGIGAFGPKGRESVLYTQVHAEKELFSLYNIWKERLNEMEMKTEQRPYRPHMTLAKKRRKEQPFIRPETPLPEALFFQASRLHLYRIHPGRSVKYETAHWAELTE